MKKIAAGFLLLLALLAELAFAQALIKDTKHNLSATTTNPIRAAAGGTTEICVFCHTPHGASTSVSQLWNRALNTATYTPYTSTYLTGLGYPTAELGNSSKLCLSCHDGVLALGAVNNTPGSGTTGSIAMVGTTAGKLPAGATNLGTTLADDHPVGHLYEPARNAELVTATTRPFPWPKGVQLDPNLATGRVECKSCHDPHNNQFTKFVRMQITDASPTPTTPASPYLCKYCHNKTNYELSGHAISTQTYVPVAGSPVNTVQKNGCLACHKSHTATGPILRGAEELACYNAGCHGNNNLIAGNVTANSGTNRRDIKTEMAKARAHPTVDPTKVNLHKNKPFVAGTGAETVADFGNSLATRHAECPDCHNPHQVQPAATVEKSTRGAIRISLALKGTWGVRPTTWPTVGTAMANNLVTFTAPAAGAAGYTVLGRSGTADANPVTDEYQVCLKCHSNYVTLPVGARNIAQEINPNNSSYHGMVPCPATVVPSAPLWNSGCNTNFFVNSVTMEAPWAGTGTFTTANSETCRLNPTANAQCTTLASTRGRVWCSDCHGSNASTMPPVAATKAAPYGPHGSTLTGIGPGISNSDRMLVRTIVSPGANTYTPLCLVCHKPLSYSAGNAGSRMGSHGSMRDGGTYATNGCFTCHMWEAGNAVTGASNDIFPHGMNKRWATIGKTATAGSLQMVDSFMGGSAQTNINYAAQQCWTAATIGTDVNGSGTVNCGMSGRGY